MDSVADQLSQLVRDTVSGTDVDQTVIHVSSAARALVGCDYAGVVLLTDDGRVGPWRGFVGNRTNAWRQPRRNVVRGPATASVLGGETVVLQRLGDDPAQVVPRTHRAEGGRTIASVPLRSREGIRGALVMGWRSDVNVDDQTLQLADTLGAYATAVLDGALAREQRTDYTRRNEALVRVARLFSVETEGEAVLRLLLSEAASLLGGRSGIVRRVDERGGLATVAVYGDADPGTGAPRRSADEGAAGMAAARRAGVLLEFDEEEADRRTLRSRSVVIAPIMLEGRLLGVVSVGSPVPRRFTQVDARTLEVMASIAAAVLVGLERSRLEGALMAVRSVEHYVNNQLALSVGYLELMLEDPELPPRLRAYAAAGLSGARAAGAAVERLRSLSQLKPTAAPPDVASGGGILDLGTLSDA